jgi:hypothetical protein
MLNTEQEIIGLALSQRKWNLPLHQQFLGRHQLDCVFNELGSINMITARNTVDRDLLSRQISLQLNCGISRNARKRAHHPEIPQRMGSGPSGRDRSDIKIEETKSAINPFRDNVARFKRLVQRRIQIGKLVSNYRYMARKAIQARLNSHSTKKSNR